MDFQAFVNCCSVPCAVLSVEKTPKGHCGDIRIVCSNRAYKDVMGPAYYDGMPYDELVPKDLKFEDFCFRAAHENQRMHAYVQTKALNAWTDQVMIPLQPQAGEVGYCQFLFEFTETADPARMARVSMDTAAAVIKASLALLGDDDFKGSVREVLSDILELSDAFACRIMLIDHERRGKAIVGYLYVVNFNVDKVVEVKELLELMSVLLGSEISNHLLMGKLEQLSTTDGLTGLRNRNAVLSRMAEIDERVEDARSGRRAPVPFGMVAVDLNGLKETNDREGHEVGDRLLVRAAELLASAFRKDDLFRMGGDEFAAVVEGITREQLEERVARLRASVRAADGVSFAIGSFWCDGSLDASAALREADEEMYADKRAHYAAFPGIARL